MSRRQIGWPDVYRPTDLKSMALDDNLRQRFEWYMARDVLPHSLILYGPPGFGKTTVATIIANTLYANDGFPRVRRIKATETGTVAAIRTNVIDSMRALPGPRLVIFDEASALSDEAQEALRLPMEDYADHCRVIFVTNKPLSAFDDALRSRCDAIEMLRPPLEECIRVLRAVLKVEGIPVAKADVEEFTKKHFANPSNDLRKLLAAAEYSVRSHHLLTTTKSV